MRVFDFIKDNLERIQTLAIALTILGVGVYFGYRMGSDPAQSEIDRLEGVINGLLETHDATSMVDDLGEKPECEPAPKRQIKYSGIQCGSRDDALSLMNSNSAYYQIQGKACLLSLKEKSG